MIQITLTKVDGKYKRLEAIGHAEFSDHGTDIVCASASMLVINTINSIENLTEDKFTVEEEEESGYIDFRFESTPSEGSVLLLDSLMIGLNSIVESYGEQYLIVNVQEV